LITPISHSYTKILPGDRGFLNSFFVPTLYPHSNLKIPLPFV